MLIESLEGERKECGQQRSDTLWTSRIDRTTRRARCGTCSTHIASAAHAATCVHYLSMIQVCQLLSIHLQRRWLQISDCVTLTVSELRGRQRARNVSGASQVATWRALRIYIIAIFEPTAAVCE